MPKGIPKGKPPVEIVEVLGRKMSRKKRDCIEGKRQEGKTDIKQIARECGCYPDDVIVVLRLLALGEAYLRRRKEG